MLRKKLKSRSGRVRETRGRGLGREKD